MTTIIKLRRDTAANWTSSNPILAAGEPGLETDTLRVKYGDGSNTWANLAYQAVGNATFATNAGTANVANLVAVANVSGIGNIATVNLDGNTSNALRGDGSFGPVDSAGTNITNGLTEVSIPTANGNVIINVNDDSAEWQFTSTGVLNLPNGGQIDNTDNNIELRAGNNINFEATGVLNIYTNDGNYQWQFGDDGNLTLPGNTFAVNYANGSAVPLGGGNATFLGYNYTIGNAEVAGEFVISNTNPANVGTFSINPVDNANVNVENLLGYVSNNKLITTICDDQSRQATYNINSVETVTISYNGYRAVYSKLYDDDPAFCKIGFYQDTSTASVITRPDTDDDEFTVNINGGTSTLLGLAIIYTENSSFVPSNANLLEYFEHFVDNIITPAAGNITDLRTNFYDEIANTTAIISSWGEDPYNLNFYDNATNSIYTSVVPTTTSGSGIDFTANVVIAGDGTYRVISYVGGSGFNTSETITFDGTLFSGITVTNDLVLTITSVSSGVVTGFTIAGTNPGEWPTNFISDGGSDQYDTGNFLKTNQQNPVPYNDGNISNSGAFGGNDWFVGYAYGQFIFFGDNTGDPVGNFGTFGETGSDGDGTRITGYLNPPLYYTFNVNSVLDYNANLSFASGSFTLSYDIAGPNLGSIIFNNDRTISVTSGDLILNAPDDITIEPTDDLRLYGGDKQTSGTTGGDVFVYGGIGGSAFNAGNDSAGDGGRVEVYGGDAGNDDGNTALGSSGGYVQIRGGQGTGNGTGGYVEITGGQGYNSGSGGNVTINGGTGPAQSAYGNVTVNVGSYNWTYANDGNLTLPGNMILAGNTNLLGSDAALIKSNNGLPLLSLSTGANSSVTSIWLENYGDIGNSNIAAIYTPLPGTGTVRIVAGTNGANINIWDFATDGALTLPANSIIQSVANNAGDGSGLSTLNLYPDNSTGDDRYLIIDPTGPNHIHIRAGGVQDASNTLLFLGGEQAYVQIDDTVHEVQIGSYDNANATSYYWRFENDGVLTAAGDISTSGNVSANNIGNIASINIDGNVSNLLTGNGTFVAIPTVGNIASINLDGNVSNVLAGDGNFVTLPVINANTVIWSTAPVSNVAAGNAGEAAYDSGGNLYVCVVANTWAKFTGTTSW